MKSHIYNLNLCLHSININVSFPCTVGASLVIDNKELQVTDNVDIKQAHVSINAIIQTQIQLLFNQRTSVYSMKKAAINFFLRTKSGKLQAGSTAIFLNKMIAGCQKQTVQISKCSDRGANVQYSMHMQLVKETQTSMTTSMMNGSQTFQQNNSIMRNSTLPYQKKIFEQSNLYESIVQQVDQKTDQLWEKGSNCSKNSAGNNSLIGDLKFSQSYKNVGSAWKTRNDSNFRRSRIQGSLNEHRNSSTGFINIQTYQNKLSASKAGFQIQIQQDTKVILEKKVGELQKQNKDLKQTMNRIRQRYQQQIQLEKNSLRKSQIYESTLKQQLQLIKQKSGSLENQANKMMFEKNQILNKYNTRQTQNTTQMKAKQKSLILQNKRLSDKVQKLQKALSGQEQKYHSIESRLKQQQGLWAKKQKQFDYYQQEAVELDEKLSQLRIVEQQLNNQLEALKEQNVRKQQRCEKELQKYKKQYYHIKEGKQQESKGLGKQLQSSKNSLKDKQNKIFTMKRQYESQKRKNTQSINVLQQERDKLQKQVKKVNQQRKLDQQNCLKLQGIISMHDQKLRTVQMKMKTIIQNRDQHLNQFQFKLQQSNIQQFRLNQQNFELQQRIAMISNQLKQQKLQIQVLQNQIQTLKQSILQKESKLNKTQKQFEQIQIFINQKDTQAVQLKIQLAQRQQGIVTLQSQIKSIQKDHHQLQKYNCDIQLDFGVKIKSKDQQIAELNKKNNQFQATTLEQSSQIDELYFKIQSLNILVYNSTNSNFNNNISKQNLKIQVLQKQQAISQLNKKYIQLQNELIQTKQKLKINIQEKQFQTKKQTNLANQQRIGLQNQLKIKNNQILQLTNSLKYLKVEKKQLAQQILAFKKTEQNLLRQNSSLEAKIKQSQVVNQKLKKVKQQLQQDFASKNKQMLKVKSQLQKKQQDLNKTESTYKQTKDKMQTQFNLQINQLKSQILELDQMITIQKEQVKGKQTRIIKLQTCIYQLKSQNSRNINETRKQMIQMKRQIAQNQKQLEKKTMQITRNIQSQAQLKKRNQSLTASNKQSTQRFQKCNQQSAGKNKEINELQATIREKVSQASKIRQKIAEFEQECARVKKQKQETCKSLISQQEINSRNAITIKQLKQIIAKKQQMLKEAQKQSKRMQGQIQTLKRLKPQQPNQQTQDSSLNSSQYSFKKIQTKKQPEYYQSIRSGFNYKKNIQSNESSVIYQQEETKDKRLDDQVKVLKQQISFKERIIIDLQQKLINKSVTSKNTSPTKTMSSTVQKYPKNAEQLMRQQILVNLQTIEKILSNPQSGTRYDKYKTQLTSLISKNKRIIFQASPFELMRQLNILLQKTRVSVQNKFKIQSEVKTLILEEFRKMQVIVEQAMGK